MYVRVAEMTSQSSLQFKMLMAFIEKEFLPRNIEAGQLSGEIFRTSDNSCFVISRFTSKAEANKIMAIMKAELEEMKGSNKIRMIEGERFINLGQQIGSSTQSQPLNDILHHNPAQHQRQSIPLSGLLCLMDIELL